MNRDYSDIRNRIESGSIAPVYFFHGEETYFKDQLTQLLIGTVVEPETRDFNMDVFSGDEVSADAVVAAASQFPMMAERRLVIVKSTERFSPSGKKRLQQVLDSPPDTTVLVFMAGTVDRRQAFWAALSKKAATLECRPLYENQAVDWLVHEMKAHERKIDKSTAELLVQKAGTSLWALKNEVEKIITYMGDRDSVTSDDVADIAGVSRKYTTWEFTDAVGFKAMDQALPILFHLLEEGESPAGLIMNLARRMQLLSVMRALHDAGNSPDRIAQAAGLRPWFNRLYMQQMQQYTREELKTAIRALLDADVHVKTGYLPPNLILTLLVHDLIQGHRRSRFYPVQEMI